MVVHDNLHSRVVFWLKITLPFVALAILSTLFLFSRKIDTDDALPYAEVDVEELAREQRLTTPEFAGVTGDGGAISVAARTARPGRDDASSTAEEVVAAYDLPGGLRIDLEAATGEIDNAAGRMVLGGGVEIVTSTGYRMITEGLDGALDKTELVSDGAVDVEAPFGTIDAGSMVLRQRAENTGYVLVFKRGVKLVYQPDK